MNSIDAILYINLEHRKDRLENVLYQLNESLVSKKLNIPKNKIHRVEACFHKNGALGCAQSHVKALDMALKNGWNKIMIIEDDFAWKKNTEYIVNCLNNVDSIDLDWSVLLLTTNVKKVKIIKEEKYNLQQVCDALTTCGYIIQLAENIKKLRDCFDNCAKNLKTGGNRLKWAIDVGWKTLQTKDKWYCFKGQLATQIPSYSDIMKKYCDYDKRKLL